MRRILLVLTLVAALVPAAPAQAASGTVPGLTGDAALTAAGPAAERFLALRKGTGPRGETAGAALDAQLHTSWGIRMPFSGGSLGMRALQSAGANTLRFGNTTGWAPDLDRITLT